MHFLTSCSVSHKHTCKWSHSYKTMFEYAHARVCVRQCLLQCSVRYVHRVQQHVTASHMTLRELVTEQGCNHSLLLSFPSLHHQIRVSEIPAIPSPSPSIHHFIHPAPIPYYFFFYFPHFFSFPMQCVDLIFGFYLSLLIPHSLSALDVHTVDPSKINFNALTKAVVMR